MRWGVWGCSTVIIAVVALMMVVAAIAYLELSEPDSPFPARLAEAAQQADADSPVLVLTLFDEPVDTLHLFAPGEPTTANAVQECLGFVWDKTELIAGHLNEGMPGAFIAVADGAVVDYGWHLVGAVPLRFTDWPCTITAADDGFVVSTENGVFEMTRAPAAAPD